MSCRNGFCATKCTDGTTSVLNEDLIPLQFQAITYVDRMEGVKKSEHYSRPRRALVWYRNKSGMHRSCPRIGFRCGGLTDSAGPFIWRIVKLHSSARDGEIFDLIDTGGRQGRAVAD